MKFVVFDEFLFVFCHLYLHLLWCGSTIMAESGNQQPTLSPTALTSNKLKKKATVAAQAAATTAGARGIAAVGLVHRSGGNAISSVLHFKKGEKGRRIG